MQKQKRTLSGWFRALSLCTLTLTLLGGCSTKVEPRIIAPCGYESDTVWLTVTSFPDEVAELAVLDSYCVAESFWDKPLKWDISAIQRRTIEGRPALAFRIRAPKNDVKEFRVHLLMQYNGRRFEIIVPYKIYYCYTDRHTTTPIRWWRSREIIRDLGK